VDARGEGGGQLREALVDLRAIVEFEGIFGGTGAILEFVIRGEF
jgi:hypothetical protein